MLDLNFDSNFKDTWKVIRTPAVEKYKKMSILYFVELYISYSPRGFPVFWITVDIATWAVGYICFRKRGKVRGLRNLGNPSPNLQGKVYLLPGKEWSLNIWTILKDENVIEIHKWENKNTKNKLPPFLQSPINQVSQEKTFRDGNVGP